MLHELVRSGNGLSFSRSEDTHLLRRRINLYINSKCRLAVELNLAFKLLKFFGDCHHEFMTNLNFAAKRVELFCNLANTSLSIR